MRVCPYLNGAAAAANISADFELAWAWREWGTARAEEVGLRERANVPVILKLLDHLDIPITWATVGHLFLESCGGDNGSPNHAGMPRPLINRRWDGDWYKHDPGTSALKHPAWYCPDLIRSIQEAKTAHEIGSHSFSHIEFSPECSNQTLVAAELLECQTSMIITRNAGYRCALTLDTGINDTDVDLLRLRRIPVPDDASVSELLVKSSGFWRRLKWARGLLKQCLCGAESRETVAYDTATPKLQETVGS